MTNPTTSASIRAELSNIALALNLAREDVVLLQRLNAANHEVDRLTKRGTELTDMLAKAMEAEHKAAKEARFAGLKDLRITETPDLQSSCVLKNGFRITYTRIAWSPDANASVPTPMSVAGFAALAPNVFEWIKERHADKIPESIAALAPGNLEDAFDRYFVALRRGYLTA